MTLPDLVAAMVEIGQQRNWALGRCADYARELAKARADIAEKNERITALELALKGGTDGAARTDD